MILTVTAGPGGNVNGSAKAGALACRGEPQRKRACDASQASEQVGQGQTGSFSRRPGMLGESIGLHKLLENILSVIRRRMNARDVSLWICNSRSDDSVLHPSIRDGIIHIETDVNPGLAESPAFRGEDPFWQEMLRTKTAAVCEDVLNDPRVAACRRDFIAEGIKAVLAVPLLVQGRVIGGIGLRHSRKRRYRTADIELVREFAQQAALAIEVIQTAAHKCRAAVLRERNRLASDIHDTLAHSLTGIIVQLEAAEDATLRSGATQAGKFVRRAAKLAREGLTETKRSLHALRPSALERGNLVTALDRLIKQMTPGSGIKAELSCSGTPWQLSPELEENLLRIGQEALTNTLKHARADRFTARLIFGPAELRFEIDDNGCGFDPAEASGGFGLTGMKQRIADMAGHLTIESGPGQGTAIRVALPDPARAQPAL